jgi:hypothetical protein
MPTLKNHPFAVAAHFDSSLVLTFAAPREHLARLLPPCLAPDTFQDKWAFVAIAMVQTRNLRPKGWPAWVGRDFFLIGYRVFVRYVNRAGKRLRGLYILQSATDSKLMEIAGNIFTHYHYSTIDIRQQVTGSARTIASERANFHLTVERGDEATPLPLGSPFANWKEARRFAGPLPFTFTYDSRARTVLIIEGVRQNWRPAPVQVHTYTFEALRKLAIPGLVLANAFEVNDVPYSWKKGVTEPWS